MNSNSLIQYLFTENIKSFEVHIHFFLMHEYCAVILFVNFTTSNNFFYCNKITIQKSDRISTCTSLITHLSL